MHDDLSQVFSRLTVLELMLEVTMANWLAAMRHEDTQAFIGQLRQGFRMMSPAGQPTMGDDEIGRRMADVHALQDHFLDKVSRRADDMRARAEPG